MIKYTLVCETAHTFEGWFRNSDDFETQCERTMVTCPICGSSKVRKALMAPAVTTSRKKASPPPANAEVQPVSAGASVASEATASANAPNQALQPSALLSGDAQQKEVIEALRLLRTRVIENSENVGSKFAAEARKIHYGEAEQRSIYGHTTPADAEALLDEGIAVLPLPELPDDKN
ncbi:DUF1178 family protein [Roseibium denhamense]|uniref:DUF1178 family protein n=1 Tax=Roseibium denhamense TaxID=76305 RepID=A0ABY1PA08_9HYPH|nr:DUF1178 family protein [Roseibium denhamense]MTI04518.1 DUF1178 family protein [Roseibium denhamense]SMP28265.1 hypothetical protein SAMN06265374_2885 [Roseibium denhamense]